MKCYSIIRKDKVLSISDINDIKFQKEHFDVLRNKVLTRLDGLSNIDKKHKEILKKSFITLFDNEGVMLERITILPFFSMFLLNTGAYYNPSDINNTVISTDRKEPPVSQLAGFINEYGDKFIYVRDIIIKKDEDDEPYFDFSGETAYVEFDSLLRAFLEAALDAEEEIEKQKSSKPKENTGKTIFKEYKTFQDFINNLNKLIKEIKPGYDDLENIILHINESLPENGVLNVFDLNVIKFYNDQESASPKKNVFFVFKGVPYKIESIKLNQYIRFRKAEEEYKPVKDSVFDGAKEEILNLDNIDHDYFNNISTELANDFRTYSKETQLFESKDDIEIYESNSAFKNILFSIFYDSILENPRFTNFIDKTGKEVSEEQKSRDKAFINETVRKIVSGRAGIEDLTNLVKKLTFYEMALIDIFDDIYKYYFDQSDKFGFNDFNEFDFLTFSITKHFIDSFNSVFFGTIRSNNLSEEFFKDLKDIVVTLKNKKYNIEKGNLSALLKETEVFIYKYFEKTLDNKFNYSEHKGYNRLKNLIIKNAAILLYNFALNFENINNNTTLEEFNRIINDPSNVKKYNYYTGYVVKSIKNSLDDIFSDFFESNYQSNKMTSEAIADYTGGNFDNAELNIENDGEDPESESNDLDNNLNEIGSLREIGVINEIILKLVLNVYRNEYSSNIKMFTFDIFNAMCMHIKNKIDSGLPLLILKETKTTEKIDGGNEIIVVDYSMLNDEDVHGGIHRVDKRESLSTPEVQVVNVYSIKDLTLFLYFSTDELASTNIMQTLNNGLLDSGVRKKVFERIVRKIKESEFIANMNVEFINDVIRVLFPPGVNENHFMSILTGKKIKEQLPSFSLFTDSGYKTDEQNTDMIAYQKGTGVATKCYITPLDFRYVKNRLEKIDKNIKTVQPFDWVIKLYNFAKFARKNPTKDKASKDNNKKSYYFLLKDVNGKEGYEDYFVRLAYDIENKSEPSAIKDAFYEWYFSVIKDLFDSAEDFIKHLTDPDISEDKNTVINNLLKHTFFKFAVLTFNDSISFKSLNETDTIRSKILLTLYNKGGIGINDMFEYAFTLAASLKNLKNSLNKYSETSDIFTYNQLYNFMLNEVIIGGTYHYNEKKITEKDIKDFTVKSKTAASFSNLLRSLIFSNAADFTNKKISEMTAIVYATDPNGERKGFPNNSLVTTLLNAVKRLSDKFNGETPVKLSYNNYTTQLVDKFKDKGYRFLHIRYIRDGKQLMVSGDTFSRWKTNMSSFMYDRTTLGLQNSIKKTLFNIYFSRNKVSYISEGRTPIEEIQMSKSLTSAIYDDFIEKLIEYSVSEILKLNKNSELNKDVLKKIIRASFKNKNILNDYYNEFSKGYENKFKSGIEDPTINYILTKIVNPLYNFNNKINEYGKDEREVAESIGKLFLGIENKDEAINKGQIYIEAIKKYLNALSGKGVKDIIPVFSYMYYISVLAYSEYQSIRKYLKMNKKKITLKHYDNLYKNVIEFSINEDGTDIKDVSNIKDLPILNYYVQNLINKLSFYDEKQNVQKANESYDKIKNKIIDVIKNYINRESELEFDKFYSVLNESFVTETVSSDNVKTPDNLIDFNTIYEYIKNGSFKELNINVMLENILNQIEKIRQSRTYELSEVEKVVNRYAEFASVFIFNYPLTTNFYDKDIFTIENLNEQDYINNTATAKNYFGFGFNPFLKVDSNNIVSIYNRTEANETQFLKIGNIDSYGSINVNLGRNTSYKDLMDIIEKNINHFKRLLPELSFIANNVFSELTVIGQISTMGDFVDYFRSGDEFIKRILSTTSSGNSVNYNINLVNLYTLPFTHKFLRESVVDGKTSVLEIEDPEVDLTGTSLFGYIKDYLLKNENKELLDTIKEKFAKSNPTDGFCYSNIHFHYFTMLGLGLQSRILSKFMKFVNDYDAVIDNKELRQKVKKKFFEWAKEVLLIEKVNIITGLKMQYAGLKEFEGMLFTSNHKYSWFPIHPLLVADNPDTENEFEEFAIELHKYMVQNNISYITSAEKINKTRVENKKHDLIVFSNSRLTLNKENGTIPTYPKVTINLDDLKLNTKNSQTKEVVPVNPKFFNIVYAVYQVYGNEGLEEVFDAFFDQSRNITMETRHKFINNVLEYIKSSTGKKVPAKLDLQKALKIIKKLGKEVRMTPGNPFLMVPGVNQETPGTVKNEQVEIKAYQYTGMLTNDNVLASVLSSLKPEELKDKKLVILLSKTDIDKLGINENGYATVEKITLNLDGSLVYISNKTKNRIKVLGTEIDYNSKDKNTIYGFDVNKMEVLPDGNHGVLYKKESNPNKINVNKNRYSYKDENGQDKSYFVFVEIDISSIVQRGISQALFDEVTKVPKVSKNISIIESYVSTQEKDKEKAEKNKKKPTKKESEKDNGAQTTTEPLTDIAITDQSLKSDLLKKSLDYFSNLQTKNKISHVAEELTEFLYTIEGQMMVGDIEFKSKNRTDTVKIEGFISFYLKNRSLKLFKTDDIEIKETQNIFKPSETVKYNNSTKLLDSILDVNFIFREMFKKAGIENNYKSFVDYVKNKYDNKVEDIFEKLFSLEKIKEFVKKYKLIKDEKADKFSKLIYHYLKLKFDINSEDTINFVKELINDKKSISQKSEQVETVDIINEHNRKIEIISFILNTEYSKGVINFARAYNALQLLGFKFISFKKLKVNDEVKQSLQIKANEYNNIINEISKINSLVIFYNNFESYITLSTLSSEYDDYIESVHILPKYNIVSGLREYTFKEMSEIVGYNRYDISWHPNFAFLLFLKNDKGEIIGDIVELNKMLANEGWVAQNRKYLEAVGLRVPLQSDSSVSIFIPRRFNFSQNAVFVNSLLLLLQGADCDFDKLFVYTKLVKVVMIDENGKEKDLYTFNNVLNRKMLLRALKTAKKISSEKSGKRIEVRLEDKPSFEYHGGNIMNVNSSIEALSELYRKGVKSLFNLLPLLDIFIIPTIKELYSEESEGRTNTDIGTTALGMLKNTPNQQYVGKTIGMLVYFQSLLSPGFVTISGKESLLDRVGPGGKTLLNKEGLLHLFTYASYTTMVEFITLAVDVVKDLSGSHIYPLMTNPLLPVFFTYINYNYLKLKDEIQNKTVLYYNKYIVKNTFLKFMIINELFKKYINVYRVDTSKPTLDKVLDGLIETIKENMLKLKNDFKLTVDYKKDIENVDDKDLDSSLQAVSGKYIDEDNNINKSEILKLSDDILFYNKDRVTKGKESDLYENMLNVYYALSIIKKLNNDFFKEQFEKMTFKPVGVINFGSYNDPNFISFMNAVMLPIVERLIKVRKDLEGNPYNLMSFRQFTDNFFSIFENTDKTNTIIHALSRSLHINDNNESTFQSALIVKLIKDLGEMFYKMSEKKDENVDNSFNITDEDIKTLSSFAYNLNIDSFLKNVNNKIYLYELRDTKTIHTAYESFINNLIDMYKTIIDADKLSSEEIQDKLKRLENGDIDFVLFKEIVYGFYEKLKDYYDKLSKKVKSKDEFKNLKIKEELKKLGVNNELTGTLNYFLKNYIDYLEKYSKEKFLYGVIHKEITFKIHSNSSYFVEKRIGPRKELLFLIRPDFKDLGNEFENFIKEYTSDFFKYAFSFLKRVNLLYEDKVTVDKNNNFVKDSDKVIRTTFKIYNNIGVVPKVDMITKNTDVELYNLFAKNYEQMISYLSSYYVSAFNLKYNFIKNISTMSEEDKNKSLVSLKVGYLAAVTNALLTFKGLILDAVAANGYPPNNNYKFNLLISGFDNIFKTVSKSLIDVITFIKQKDQNIVTISKQEELTNKIIGELVTKQEQVKIKDKTPDGKVISSASNDNEINEINNYNCK